MIHVNFTEKLIQDIVKLNCANSNMNIIGIYYCVFPKQ
jgi:hypothetical protein